MVTAAALLLGACGEGSSAGALSLAPDQAVRMPVPHDPGNLDPAIVQGVEESDVDANIFSTLVRVDNSAGSIRPDLAEAMPEISADGRVYTFALRAGARFSNGDPLSAADIVYSWSRAAAFGGAGAAIFGGVEGYQDTVAGGGSARLLSGLAAIGQGSLEVKLSQPQSTFLDRLGSVAAAVVDEKVIASTGDRFGQSGSRSWASQPATLIGSGPYRMTARVPGRSIDFAPVPDWWGAPKPIVRSVHLDVVPDIGDAVSSFPSSPYDLIGYGGFERVPTNALTPLRTGSFAEGFITVPRAASTWVGFNYRYGPFSGPGENAHRLRQAFALAVDGQKLSVDVCHGRVTCVAATGGLVPPGLRGYSGDGTDALATPDSTHARELLRLADPDATATKGLVVDVPDSPENVALFGFLQDQWQRNLGVHVDRRASTSRAQPGAPPTTLFVARWVAAFDDPQDLLGGYFATAGASNLGGFSDPSVDALVSSAQAQLPDASLNTYARAAAQLQADAAYIPLYYDSGTLLVKSHLQGAGLGSLFDGPWSTLAVLQ